MLLFERYLLVSRFPLETSPNLGMSQLRRTRGIARKRASSDGPLPPLFNDPPVASDKRLQRSSHKTG